LLLARTTLRPTGAYGGSGNDRAAIDRTKDTTKSVEQVHG
jgi:hypothetical protein